MEMFTVTIRHLYAILVFTFLSPVCCSLGLSWKDHFFRLNRSSLQNYISLDYSHRSISAEDILATVKAVRINSSESIMVLIGQEYKDLTNDISRYLSEEVIDVMFIENDWQLEPALGRSLKSVKKKTTLLLVDMPTKIVYLFQMMRMKMVKTHVVKWILFMEGNDAVDCIAELEEFVNEGTKLTIFVKTFEGPWNLYLPSVDLHGVTRFKKECNWKSRINLEDLFPEEKTYSLSGRQLTVAVKDHYMVIKSGRTLPDGSLETVSGGDITVLNILSSVLNFTYKAFTSKDDKFGDLSPDGNVTGIIGMVARREVSLGMAFLSITATRIKAVEFTSEYFSGSTLLLSLAPKKMNRSLAVLDPFEIQVWICLAVAVVLIGSFVFLISRFTYTYMSADVKNDVQWVVFNMFRNVVNQGNGIKDEFHQVRAVLSLWFFFCVIISALYSGMLTAVLAIPAYDTPIDSFHDLPRAVKEGFSIGTLGGSSYVSFFKYATEGVIKQTWNLLNHEGGSKTFVDNNIAGIQKVLQGKFIFITSDSTAEVFDAMYGKQTFHLSKERLSRTYSGIACQKGSPVKRAISKVLLTVVEAGIMKKILDDGFRTVPSTQLAKEEEKKNVPFTIKNLQAAFYIYVIGMAVASLALLVEGLCREKGK